MMIWELAQNKKGKKLWISPKAMVKKLHINFEYIYKLLQVVDLAVILCDFV
jgi:hypothetical protein